MVRSRIPQITAELRPRLDAALRDGAEKIAAAAKQRVPVQSGALRTAIHTETDADGVYVIAGDNDAFYGHMVEFGTTHTPARPFLIPALEETSGEVVKDARNAVRRSVGERLRGLF
jgi:HK97 gp10 family phage protein